ncbi:MAG TPA: DUF5683 domain-containing protein [Candidatus Syntrophosphaera thermopropionivorans]|uniref:Uncharacterized protein n=1 Tax=Candidatus Syntrophosphaera thermopropionivorans TaxID=2593015 RepID=A0AC61QK53_9BACT|nr:hypothetical protein E0946_02665 [Candidatus Syntrophosphaera thermopropionivorans]HOR29992.1 DUF5683 domain-containing protein [Candidatus Syntrophosphaera thermopropionivorans]HOZ92221.1 DUF5683 domain-containing protein [Candidatus Syntrophosphaera thermopropionivorans]HQF81608.1 DUF5683 domain-containing protein [Candidatus Syntrophosphaera thermopropionivorans]HQH46981.1 DUF5683 domain-containing protein [Candidatus Syntrophosphaera thermopropionivorans]
MMRKFMLISLLLFLTVMLTAQTQFDINVFADTTKYGWQDWRDRLRYREDLMHRQQLLQIYEMQSNPLRPTVLKSVVIPGWGQLACKDNLKGSVILGTEVLSLGVSLYFYDKSNYYYNKYMQANQIEQIEDYFDKAQDQRFYSLLFMGLGGVIWAYNIFDVIQTTEDYNAQVWQEILEKYSQKTVTLTPGGIRLQF